MGSIECKRCGANVYGMVCESCGSLNLTPSDPVEEKRAVNEFHDILLTKEEAEQIRLIQNGFLPSSLEALLEAGVRSIPLIDMSNPASDISTHSVARLEPS